MSKPPVLHPRTQAQIEQYLAQPSHALLIIGGDGMGKGSVARSIAAKILNYPPENVTTHPYVTIVEPDGTSISVETMRNIQRLLQLRTPGNTALRRAVIIEHAQTMTTEAQNAFLKLLEEPPEDTVILMTVDNQHSVLPTILSRAQTLHITAPSKSSLQDHFQHHDSKKVEQAYFMSGGLPGLMHALLEDSEHPLLTSVGQAKAILAGTTFERLAIVESLSKQRADAQHTIEALRHIAETTLLHTSKTASSTKIKQWHKILKLSNVASEQLGQSANTKLALTNLMLQL